jgi:FtsH-binding integral membrane protein
MMTAGVALSGVTAWVVASMAFGEGKSLTPLGQALFNSPLVWVLFGAPLLVVLAMTFGFGRMSSGTLKGLFFTYAGLLGVSLASIFAVYAGGTITKAFFIAASTFGAMSLWGYTTRRSLDGMGSFLIMGLFGIIIASIANIFIGSGPMDFAISVLAVLIISGLTAYDTQKIKEMYFHAAPGEEASKLAVLGALNLYLDFVNIFIHLLRIMKGDD